MMENILKGNLVVFRGVGHLSFKSLGQVCYIFECTKGVVRRSNRSNNLQIILELNGSGVNVRHNHKDFKKMLTAKYFKNCISSVPLKLKKNNNKKKQEETA